MGRPPVRRRKDHLLHARRKDTAVGVELVSEGPPEAAAAALDRIRQMAGALGSFTQSRLAVFRIGRVRRGELRREVKRTSLLSCEELATLFHPPTASVAAERMRTADFLELEPPPRFPSGAEPNAVTLGRVLFRNDERLIGLEEDARRRHLYVIGSTGAGKSTLLLNLIRQDMLAGRGLTVIDVHGDLADSALQLVPKHRTNDAILFEPASGHAPPFNPLACDDPSRIDQVASGVVSAFRKLYDSWGPRLENLLRAAAFAVVESGGTLQEMLRMLTEAAYRERAVLQIRDEVVRSFWVHEFASWNAQYRTEAVSSVTNKLVPFLTSRTLRAVTTGSGSSLNLRRMMDEGKILIANLSRGKLGQDNATLLGSLLLTSIEQTALTRADIPEHERRDHYLYLDEFQSLVTPSTAIMLSESRKYRLCLTLSHQLTRQLDEDTYHAVLGNCGSILSFRLGLEDAERLSLALSKHQGQLSPEALCNLPNFTAYARLLLDGKPSQPISLRTLPVGSGEYDATRADVVRQRSKRH